MLPRLPLQQKAWGKERLKLLLILETGANNENKLITVVVHGFDFVDDYDYRFF